LLDRIETLEQEMQNLQRQQNWTDSVVSASDQGEKSPQCRLEDREIQEFLHGTGI